MNKEEGFIRNRLRSFKFAFAGAWALIRKEPSVQVQAGTGILVTLAGIYFEIDRIEWIFQILAMGLVLSAEGLNTAIEKISDFIHPEFHVKIGEIKDVSAGAVTFAALAALGVGIFIYAPRVAALFN
ncbi:diacylglycerol kinase family protein [Flavimarina sp. Hel_I_48]|uniref:diacylglycerol kinase family protein n=1 Tax=Flavimarina sp. Hel_I_48 TaxID=1392488 RepID=UPI0004DF14EF|nr:diacylglycerol kinase family protein [Flavimarina sp. Hel_I_48]